MRIGCCEAVFETTAVFEAREVVFFAFFVVVALTVEVDLCLVVVGAWGVFFVAVEWFFFFDAAEETFFFEAFDVSFFLEGEAVLVEW